jgi:hypothetical protein
VLPECPHETDFQEIVKADAIDLRVKFRFPKRCDRGRGVSSFVAIRVTAQPPAKIANRDLG